ncbi:YfcC family protein, partial [Salmonella enterica]|nr:YfcC family protein [Salmonella enterica]
MKRKTGCTPSKRSWWRRSATNPTGYAPSRRISVISGENIMGKFKFPTAYTILFILIALVA